MSKITGQVNVDSPAGWEQGMGAVARLHAYGVRNGYVGSVYVNRENAQEIADRLDRLAGVRATRTTPTSATLFAWCVARLEDSRDSDEVDHDVSDAVIEREAYRLEEQIMRLACEFVDGSFDETPIPS